MMYQVSYKINGHEFASDSMPKEQALLFIERLANTGIKAGLVAREERKYRCPKIVYDIQLVDEARKACKEGKEMDGLYTFGDPTEKAIKDTLGRFKRVDGVVKVGYIVDVWSATADEIAAFKTKIGYKHLGLYIGKA